jgi:hypothetical protein
MHVWQIAAGDFVQLAIDIDEENPFEFRELDHLLEEATICPAQAEDRPGDRREGIRREYEGFVVELLLVFGGLNAAVKNKGATTVSELQNFVFLECCAAMDESPSASMRVDLVLTHVLEHPLECHAKVLMVS